VPLYISHSTTHKHIRSRQHQILPVEFHDQLLALLAAVASPGGGGRTAPCDTLQGVTPDLKLICTALHWMQGGLVTRKVSVCPSVRPSVRRVNCDKTSEKSVQIFITYDRSFSLFFRGKEMVGGERPLLPKI